MGERQLNVNWREFTLTFSFTGMLHPNCLLQEEILEFH